MVVPCSSKSTLEYADLKLAKSHLPKGILDHHSSSGPQKNFNATKIYIIHTFSKKAYIQYIFLQITI
ncbi:hypothetical protein RJT34_26522 [Clitoria ternatea]|uniref:Uncharacterized protein n=1 Tax=Clitoria ternatea TaxID=43366 RepID=A0AAN9F6S7_CLITE